MLAYFPFEKKFLGKELVLGRIVSTRCLSLKNQTRRLGWIRFSASTSPMGTNPKVPKGTLTY
jgi:hypothetical protein